MKDGSGDWTVRATLPDGFPGGMIDQATIAQHELVESYCRAGFSRPEAMQLLLAMVAVAASEVRTGKPEGSGGGPPG